MNFSGERLAWITGAGGLIGHTLASHDARSSCFRPRPLQRSDLDLLNANAVTSLFAREQPALIIHCAALSKNPACEANPALAHRINVEATRHLVQLASNCRFIFFSTDLVFDGTKGSYVEEDSPNPLSTYARTKVEAEAIVRAHPNHLILRISLTGGISPTRDRGFNEEMENAWRAGKTLHLFTDEYRCPMAAMVTARAVWELATHNATGTFHLCGSERLSRYQIGALLAERHPELNPGIIPGFRRDYQGPPRPADTSMNCAKIQKLLNFRLPGFTEWLGTNPNIDF